MITSRSYSAIDAGKSTISGQILFSTGVVDTRTIEKYEREAQEKNRGSWFLAYILVRYLHFLIILSDNHDQIFRLQRGLTRPTHLQYRHSQKNFIFQTGRICSRAHSHQDTNEEERAKGKTVEVGRAHFSTEKKRYTIMDAPGHKSYVPNMIQGVAQADIGILVRPCSIRGP